MFYNTDKISSMRCTFYKISKTTEKKSSQSMSLYFYFGCTLDISMGFSNVPGKYDILQWS